MAHGQHFTWVQINGGLGGVISIYLKRGGQIVTHGVQSIITSPDQPLNQFMCGYNHRPWYGIDKKVPIDRFQLKHRRGVPIQQKQFGA